jgi:hypothetical protein
MFGTAYLPEHKPEKYGLYYEFPRDYFLQHVALVKRIDENKLLKNELFRSYYTLRSRILKQISKYSELNSESGRNPHSDNSIKNS